MREARRIELEDTRKDRSKKGTNEEHDPELDQVNDINNMLGDNAKNLMRMRIMKEKNLKRRIMIVMRLENTLVTWMLMLIPN